MTSGNHETESASSSPLKSEGRLIVLSGPSGAGKTSLLDVLLAQPGYQHATSATTRAKRAGETENYHYTFISSETFETWEQEGRFLEHATVHGNRYGTLIENVQQIVDSGRVCVLDIDVQGARTLREKGLDCTFVFVSPPSLAELERRLRARATDAEEAIQKRLAIAESEMEEGKAYDLVVVNDDLKKAVDTVVSFMKERKIAPLPKSS